MKVRNIYQKNIKRDNLKGDSENVEQHDNEDFSEQDEWDDIYDEISRLEKKPRVRKAPKEWNDW